MIRLSRPWLGKGLDDGEPFSLRDCLISEINNGEQPGRHSVLMRSKVNGVERLLVQHPYPKKMKEDAPRRDNFLVRPKTGKEMDAPEESVRALARMNEVIARVQELEEALDDPSQLWPHLRMSWDAAEHEEEPRMAEIVKQARDLATILKELKTRIRRVLRRERELTPLDRVQEMDRGSMVWLSRQPGSTVAERAGSEQRIMAVIRRENFDTLENRVMHAYCRLAFDVSQEWLREHSKAQGSQRYATVEGYHKLCKGMASDLRGLGIGVALADISPNYVLMEDRGYRAVREAWEKLLRRENAKDELWAWQAETWTEFAVLCLVLAIHEMPDAHLIAQSPIIFRNEAVNGIWFDQERPIAVFWLKKTGRVVEVMARPEEPGTLQFASRAHVALKISNPMDESSYPHRVAVWTPHALSKLDPKLACREALERLVGLQQIPNAFERIKHGLILTPGHHEPAHEVFEESGLLVDAIAFDAAGASLAFGRNAIAEFLSKNIWGA